MSSIEDSIKRAAVDTLESLIESKVFFSPPPPTNSSLVLNATLLLEVSNEFTNTADILDFVGCALFFTSGFSVIFDVLESEDLKNVLTFQDYDYAMTPVFLMFGLLVGFVSYCLSYTQFKNYQIVDAGHLALSTLQFMFFSKHLCKMNELAKRRTNILVAMGVMPLICLVMIKAQHVSVKSERLLYLIVMCISMLPLPALFRDWRAGMYDATQNKNKKRLFFLYFLLLVFIGLTTPTLKHKNVDRSNTIALGFDLLCLYFSIDSLWLSAQ